LFALIAQERRIAPIVASRANAIVRGTIDENLGVGESVEPIALPLSSAPSFRKSVSISTFVDREFDVRTLAGVQTRGDSVPGEHL
jgi:hypothetical protein